MKITSAAVLFVLALALPATAQTKAPAVQSIDMNALGWGVMVAMPQAIETDGDPATQEWLVPQVWTYQKRILKIKSDGAMCAGDWFVADFRWTLQLVNGLHVYTQMVWPHFNVMHLRPLTPRC